MQIAKQLINILWARARREKGLISRRREAPQEHRREIKALGKRNKDAAPRWIGLRRRAAVVKKQRAN